jgi:hypothetical protein
MNPVEQTLGAYFRNALSKCASSCSGVFLTGTEGAPRLVSCPAAGSNAMMLLRALRRLWHDRLPRWFARKSGDGRRRIMVVVNQGGMIWSPGFGGRWNGAAGTDAVRNVCRATGWSVD